MKWFEKLQFARKVLGISLEEAADTAKISKSYLCEIENGRVEDPSYFKIIRLLGMYNLDNKDMT